MKARNHIVTVLTFISAIFLFLTQTEAQKSFDSLKLKLPKHYFKTIILIDGYNKPTQNIKLDQSMNDTTADFLSKRLKTYGVKQFVFSLNTPLLTIEKPTGDSGVMKNTHVLLTANYMSLQPVFGGIQQHNLYKAGIGLRFIFNSGKKSVWFMNAFA